MPSWNIHTAHVERLLRNFRADELGIADANAFLFGNYVPDIYVGFMVPDATFRIDYCLTHVAVPHATPVPNANQFWDECIFHPTRKAATPAGTSLALGAWAHLVADRFYNARVRAFCEAHDLQASDELRRLKQADFDLFGHSLEISSNVEITPELLEAARAFRPYSILPDDVKRAVDVASAIVSDKTLRPTTSAYQLLDAEWMRETFETCNAFLATWLQTRRKLLEEGGEPSAESIMRVAGS